MFASSVSRTPIIFLKNGFLIPVCEDRKLYILYKKLILLNVCDIPLLFSQKGSASKWIQKGRPSGWPHPITGGLASSAVWGEETTGEGGFPCRGSKEQAGFSAFCKGTGSQHGKLEGISCKELLCKWNWTYESVCWSAHDCKRGLQPSLFVFYSGKLCWALDNHEQFLCQWHQAVKKMFFINILVTDFPLMFVMSFWV